MLLLGCRLAAKAESNRGPCPWSQERIPCIPGLITRCSFLFRFVRCEPVGGGVRTHGKAGSDSLARILPHTCAGHCHGASALALRSESSSSQPRLKGLHRNLVATRRPPSHHIGVSFQDSGQLCLLSSRVAPPGPLKWNHRRELDFPGSGTCVRCSLISAQAAGPPQPGYGAPPVLGHALLTLVGTET